VQDTANIAAGPPKSKSNHRRIPRSQISGRMYVLAQARCT